MNSRRDVAPDVGRRIQARREELGLSIQDLAGRLGRDARRVGEFEREGVGTLRLVAQIARALEIWPGTLAFGTPPNGPANDGGDVAFDSRSGSGNRSDGRDCNEDTAPE